ncbi:MAG: PcfJ domain-containing protein [Clostridia bacterium]|nr:PcfJ domain-containing protein [Clostridia bacterium]
MKIEKIKPVPKYIVERIRRLDNKKNPTPSGLTRYYSYLTKNDGELVKVTVAVRNQWKNWYYKQVAVHGIDSDICFVKDMVRFFLGNLAVGWYEEGLTKSPKWYEDKEWGWHYDKNFDPYAPCVNLEYAKKINEFKYSALEDYDYSDIIPYLRRYRKYPQAEYLVKLGLSDLTKSVQILRLLGKSKDFQRWISKNRLILKERGFYVSSIISAFKKGIDNKEANRYEIEKKHLCSEKDYKPIREMLKGEYAPYIKYIREKGISNRLYLDYLRACNYLEMDMSIPRNRYPHDFKRWHDIRIDEYNTKKMENDKRERAEFYEKFGAVAEKYLPMQNDKNAAYLVIIAKSPAELKAEGKALHHCVGSMGYEQKFAREETLIFFIRSADAPDVPLVTMEYSLKSKKILQCYANGNTKPADDITTYINTKWLPYAKRQLKKIAA